jgi:hypothetical protein
MKINEVITKKERVDEVLPALVPLAVTAARTALPYALRYGKKAYDYGKKLLPVMKKAKAASHGIGSKVHAAGEIGKKIVKKSPPTPGDGSEIDKTAMVPGPQTYHKQVPPKQVARPARPQGKMSPEANAAIAQVQQARLQKKRQRP